MIMDKETEDSSEVLLSSSISGGKGLSDDIIVSEVIQIKVNRFRSLEFQIIK